MAFSGTVSQTRFDLRKIIDRAYGRCRIGAQRVTGEMIDDAKDELHLMLSEWVAQQTPLWVIESKVYGMAAGDNSVDLGAGTMDVYDVNLRTTTDVGGSATDTSTSRTLAFTSATAVAVVGIKWTGAPVALTFERSDDGVTWTTVHTETPDVGAGEWSWHDMPTVVAASYFRVTGAAALSFSTMHFGNSPSETALGRWSRDIWFDTPDKTATNSAPNSFWLDRQVAEPVLRIWPTPNAAAETSQLVVHRTRYIMDLGTLTQDVEVPQRWLNAVVAGLAARLALIQPEVPMDLASALDTKAAQALAVIQSEEYDASPVRLLPNFSCYTR